MLGGGQLLNDLGWFRRLKGLQLSHNGLSELPPELALLSSTLESLDLSHNQLEQLPPVLKHLTGLTSLSLNSNSLTSKGLCPDILGSLVNLDKLSLVNNRLHTPLEKQCQTLLDLAKHHSLTFLALQLNYLDLR